MTLGDLDAPSLARCVAVLRTRLDHTDLAALPEATTGGDLDALREDLDQLLDALDELAHRTLDARDRLDDLGAPEGGTRMTSENGRRSWQRAVMALACPQADVDRLLDWPRVRVRVILDTWSDAGENEDVP